MSTEYIMSILTLMRWVCDLLGELLFGYMHWKRSSAYIRVEVLVFGASSLPWDRISCWLSVLSSAKFDLSPKAYSLHCFHIFPSVGWNELLIAGFSHRSTAVTDGILLSTGLHIHRSSAHQAGVGTIFDRVLTELVAKMREMKMDKTELGCLRAIVLFNPGELHFSPEPLSRSSRYTSGLFITI